MSPLPHLTVHGGLFLQGNQRGSDRASIADEGYAASLSPTRIREGLRDMAAPQQRRAQVARQYNEALVKYLGNPFCFRDNAKVVKTNNNTDQKNEA
jgi:hypothetical protein